MVDRNQHTHTNKHTLKFILQWNINGFYTHLEMLKLLMSEIQPTLLCLQETHFKNNTNKLKNFSCFFKNRTGQEKASGGVAIYVKNTLAAEEIELSTNIEAVAVTLHTPNIVHVCNIYIPPNQNTNLEEYSRLLEQIPTPRIILGDFNSHNILWGSETTNTAGKTLATLIDNENLVVMNNGEGTRLDSFSGKSSILDLCLTDPSLAMHLKMEVLQYLYGSDHYPIEIKYEEMEHHKSTTLKMKPKKSRMAHLRKSSRRKNPPLQNI